MTESNIEIWKRVIAAFNEEGLDAALEFFAEDAELFDPDLPSGPLRGHAQIREVIGQMLSGFESMRVADVEFIPVDDRVVGLFHIRGHGKGSLGEMQVEVRDAHVMTFEDGRIVHWRLYLNQDEALADAGLPPRSAESPRGPEAGEGGGEGRGKAS